MHRYVISHCSLDSLIYIILLGSHGLHFQINLSHPFFLPDIYTAHHRYTFVLCAAAQSASIMFSYRATTTAPHDNLFKATIPLCVQDSKAPAYTCNIGNPMYLSV